MSSLHAEPSRPAEPTRRPGPIPARLPRDLHPVAWWVWAFGLATAASFTTNPFVLVLLAGIVSLVVAAKRSDHPWGRSFRLYLWLAALVIVMRVVFRVIFGSGGIGGHVWLDLPEIPLPDIVAGITLLGPITQESVLAGLYDGLRLAAIIVCIGAANSLANPRRLLRSVPPALYEIGTALVVSVSVFPQLADSARRVVAARELRGSATGGRIRGLRRLIVPILEDALERSLALAAGMDVRGYGRSGTLTARQRAVTGTLMLAALCGICVGTYAFLDQTAPRWLAGPMLALGVVLAVAGLAAAGRRVTRSRYRPDPWHLEEFVVMASGITPAVLAWEVTQSDLIAAYPPLDATPVVTGTALLAVLVAGLPALVAPPPRLGLVPR